MMISVSDTSQLGVQELVKVISGLLSRDKGDTKSHHYSEGGSQGKLEVDRLVSCANVNMCMRTSDLLLLVVQCVLGLMLLHNSM